MNITMNSASLLPSGEAAVNSAANGAAPAEGLPLDPALAAAQPGMQAPLAFLQFMQVDAALPAEPGQPALDGAAPDAAADSALPAVAQTQDEATDAAAASSAEPLLAAMSMPLMPSMMAMPAALAASMRLAGTPERQERAADAAPVAAAANAGATAGTGATAAASAGISAGINAGINAGTSAATSAGAVELPLAAAQPALDPAGAQPARAAAALQSGQPGAAAAQAAPLAPAGDAARAAADGQGAAGNAAQGLDAGFGVAAPSTSSAPAAARDGGTLSLSGPPTAWRQSLQEALGDRLNLQLGKNAEQAVIRLDPPMLGRVEISIRHAAGSLEVNITATHSEVLRQLNTVSENLRSDLAGRQYADVSVNVSQAPRAQASAQAGAGFGADAQGRGRQQGQDQDQRAPGAALAEANQSSSAFSLNGRA